MMVSRKVFCGATWPLRTGIFAGPGETSRELYLYHSFRMHDAQCAPRMEPRHCAGPKFPQVWFGWTGGSCWVLRRKWTVSQEAHCTRGGTEPSPASCFQVERSGGVCFSPRGGGLPGRWYFFLLSQSVGCSGPLLQHCSPLLWGGPGELSDERR